MNNVAEQKNLIWRVVGITSAILVLISLLACIFTAVFAPRVYGDFVGKLGFKNAALTSYEYQYFKSQDINDLYYWNKKSITAKNNTHIVRAFEQLEDNSKFDEFIVFVESANVSSAISKLAMVYVSNEEDYLKGNYVQALHFTNSEKAFDYAYQDLTATNVDGLDDRYNFVLGYYIGAISENDCAYFTQEVLDNIVSYKQQLNELYRDNFETDDLVEKYQLSNINYRLIKILQAMKVLNEKIGAFELDSLNNEVEVLSGELLDLTR